MTCCFSSTAAASGAQEVADLSAPWQKAPDAERGASKVVQATSPGYKAATMLACTPPILNPHMPACRQPEIRSDWQVVKAAQAVLGDQRVHRDLVNCNLIDHYSTYH